MPKADFDLVLALATDSLIKICLAHLDLLFLINITSLLCLRIILAREDSTWHTYIYDLFCLSNALQCCKLLVDMALHG